MTYANILEGKIHWDKYIERPTNVPTLETLLEYKRKGIKYKDIPREEWKEREEGQSTSYSNIRV